MFKNMSNPAKYAAAGVAAVALAFGAYAVGNSNSGNSSNGTANAAQSGQFPRNGQPRAGFGTPVTGTEAAKVKAAALAKYNGTVGRIIKLPNGSYVAQVTTSSGELRVAVSKDFQVTGARQGGPGPGGPMNGGQSVPGSSS
jgi:hypothetical protein